MNLITDKKNFRLLVCIGLLIGSYNVKAQTPTYQDCLGAIPICDDTITIGFNHNGMGNYANEIANVSGCYATEQRSIWLKFTIQQAGVLRFEINPLNVNQDHDWTLFNMTSASCSQLSSFTGAAANMVRSNTWGVFGNNGSTGVSTPNGGSGTCNGPGNFNGPKWCADLNVPAGNTYYLHITNWTGSVYGFTVDFSSSTAVLFDNVPPAMDTITSSVNCHIFDSLVVEFNENVLCNSLQAGDFQLTGPSGNHTITSVSALTCTGNLTNTAVIHFSPAVSTIGDYQLAVKPGAGYIEDACGNLDIIDTMDFHFDGYVETILTAQHLECFEECTGEINLSLNGGAAPFTYSWSNGLPTGTSQNNLCAGTYVVTVLDDVGCEVIDSVEVEQPDDITTALLSDYNISCPTTTACDGGATVEATGGVAPYFYSWSSGEIGASASSLCAGSNHVTVTDANGCLDTFEVIIGTPAPLHTFGFGDTLICISNFASLAASATGGTSPYNYIWKLNNITGTVISTNQVVNVNPDTTTFYNVQVIDDKGCVGDSATVEVKVRPPLGLELPYVDTICPYDTIELVVQGTGGDSNYTYSWGNGMFGNTLAVSPDEPSWIYVTVADLCGTPSYTDSIFVQVGGYSSINVSLRVESDSICIGESVYIIASGRGGFKGPDEFIFNWEHTTDQNPIQFVKPTSTKTYTASISDLCLSEPGSASITIAVGKPESPVLGADPESSCGTSDITVFNKAFVESSRYNWYFSDGSSFLDYGVDSLYGQFSKPGCYDVSIEATTAFGCVSTTDFACLFEILMKPVANFDFDPAHPSNTNPFISILNTSTNDKYRMWIIDGDTILDAELIYRAFEENGSDSIVKLLVRSDDGCTDTISRTVPFIMETLLYYPKSFTPNGDGRNDVFLIVGEAISMEGFQLDIFDRWGGLLFTTKDPKKAWNGKSPDGTWLPLGSYPFVLRYRNHNGESRIIRDHILISKSGNQRGLR